MTNSYASHHACSCKEERHDCRRVVLTGGPGAGKTAILEIARRNFCEHIAILPEAAGIIFSGGFWRHDTVPARKAAQRAIYYVQRESERLVEGERNSAIALCDRGTLDSLAYWPETEARFWEEIGSTREKEFSRYSAIIHLRTPPLERGYNNQNPIRIETAKQALAIAYIRAELPECCRGHKIEELGSSG